jgi:hypothetical protein
MTTTKDTGSAIAAQTNAMLPAHLQGGKKSSLGNIDQNDLIIPRVKLLQATSPEIEAFTERGAKIGQFWHTLAEQPLGDKLKMIPLVLKKELVLWAPRGDDRGILARSSDCVNWDAGYANLEFEVKLKGIAKPVKYYTRGNVAESGLAEFGSMIPDDPKSRPAASLTYRFMFFFPDHPDLSPAIVINTRSSIRPGKALISKIESKPVDHYGQLFVMGTTTEKSDDGDYKGYSYTSDGYASEEDYEKCKKLYERFKDEDWKANEESDDVPAGGGSQGGAATSDKF